MPSALDPSQPGSSHFGSSGPPPKTSALSASRLQYEASLPTFDPAPYLSTDLWLGYVEPAVLARRYAPRDAWEWSAVSRRAWPQYLLLFQK